MEDAYNKWLEQTQTNGTDELKAAFSAGYNAGAESVPAAPAEVQPDLDR